jgi:hypothetical protein
MGHPAIDAYQDTLYPARREPKSQLALRSNFKGWER